MSAKALVSSQISKATKIVPHLTPDKVKQLATAAGSGRNEDRNRLLILVFFQTGLRISEALTLTPAKIRSFNGNPALEIKGKGNKPRLVACPGRLAEQLQAYAYQRGIGFHDRFFPIFRKTA